MSVTIYRNPRCSKSRAALALLQEYGFEPTIVEYLDAPPTPARLRELLDLLGLKPRDLMRRPEAPHRNQELDRDGLSDTQPIQVTVDRPILIERPIVPVEKAGRKTVAIGRPLEAVLALL